MNMRFFKRVFLLIPVFFFLFFLVSCKNKQTGTYYLYENDDYNKEVYIILEKDKWKDDDNASGDYTISGDTITFYVELFGFKEELYSGTIKDGIMKIEDLGPNKYYCKEGKKPSQTSTSNTPSSTGHTHQFLTGWSIDKDATCIEAGIKSHHCIGCHEKTDATSIPPTGHTFWEWKVTKEATETTKGVKERICRKCNYVETSEVEMHKHQYGSWQMNSNEHWQKCEICNFINTQEHEFKIVTNNSLKCEICQKEINVSYNLKFTLSEDGKSYCVNGFNGESSSIVIIPNEYNGLPVLTISNAAFENDTVLTEVYIDEGIISIGDKAFMEASHLKKIKFPNSLQILGDSSFENCRFLKNIDLHNTNLVSIGAGALAKCGIEKIIFPSTLKLVGNNVFEYCSYLTDVYYEGTIGDWCNITLNNGVFSSSYNLNHFYLRNSNNEWEEVTSIEIPNTIKKIGDYQFCVFNNVTSITIPDSVTSIGEGSFKDCYNITSIVIPNSVTSIGASAFYDCSSLKSIVIPINVTSIGYQVFSGCCNLRSIVIPDNVTIIELYAFDDCSCLKTVYYKGTSSDWKSIVIGYYGNEPLSSATIYYYSETEPTEEGNYWYYYIDGSLTHWN